VSNSLKVADEAESEKRRYRRKGTVLGVMHAEKMAAWEYMTGACPKWGDTLEVGDVVTRRGGGESLREEIAAVVPAGKTGRAVAREMPPHPHVGYHVNIHPTSPSREATSYLVSVQYPRRQKLVVLWPDARRLEKTDGQEGDDAACKTAAGVQIRGGSDSQ